MNYKLLIILFSLFTLTGCGSPRALNTGIAEEPVPEPTVDPFKFTVSSNSENTTQDHYYYYLSAQRHMKQNELDRAILNLQKAIELDPKTAFLKRELAMYHLQQQNSDAALNLIEKLLVDQPEDTETLFLYARTLEILERKDDAKTAYERLVSVDPQREMAFLRLGDLYLEENDLDNAYRIYSTLLENYPLSHAAHFFLGKIHSVREEYEKAEHHLLRTLDLFPGAEEPSYELADIYKAKGDKQKAVAIYQELLDQSPENIFAALALADLYHGTGSKKQAAELLKRIGADNADDPHLFRIIAREYLEQDRYETAMMLLSGMLKGAPGNPGLSYLMGISLAGNGQHEEAIAFFKQVDTTSRFFVRAALQVSLLYQDMGQVDSAIDFISGTIEARPDIPDLYLYLGMFYEEKTLFEKAIQAYQNGLQLDERHVQVNYRLGVVFDILEKKEQSIEQMKTVLRLEPKHVNALNHLGYTYADMGINLDEAEQMIRTALESRPEDGAITDSLGWVFFQKGLYEQALIYLEKAVHLVPDDPIILEHLGDVYLKLDQTQKALDYYRRSLSLRKEDTVVIQEKIKSLLEKGRQP